MGTLLDDNVRTKGMSFRDPSRFDRSVRLKSCFLFFLERRREPGKKEAPTWRVFSLKELHSATNNFNYDNKLGEGGFGSVYWGQLWDGSQVLSPCIPDFSCKYLGFSSHTSIWCWIWLR